MPKCECTDGLETAELIKPFTRDFNNRKFGTEGKTSAGNWFHNFGTLEVKERPNQEVSGVSAIGQCTGAFD